ncbi:MAG: OmpH family outer membrane protein [Prevotella sp.]|jgi:outer membrane protein|nr:MULTISPECIES: OmpH family outer membrane protein [unclassified Prevotella]MCH3969376.1 OmpH family outer membrane protein [Prevotella sp.]MCH3985562.1 OmpH family outer membrane protein [Prevotella sp.]MCH3991780.1 OmpH family outer membrane protein [Prevotella sp.]MCH4017664.1 OmpH family outer membrane protein [Prevotella sp.]MCH4186596.1 OmpH family outer membrane protein [Prevotella sp.]
MKKNILGTLAVVAITALGMTSCNKQQPQVEPESETAKAPANLKVAYVEVDSIMTQYAFAKQYSQLLQKKSINIQNTINARGQQLQAAAANFQQKVQQNAYTREQAQAIQEGLQRQQADLQSLQQRLGNEFQAEQSKYNKALHDSISHYLTIYNKDKKYSIIFSKSGDNLLYANKAYDITNEVIAGLNKAYKGKLNTTAK